MKELKQNWLDLFNGFKLALCLSKMANAFIGLAISFLGLWAITQMPVWVTTVILSSMIFLGLAIRAAMKGKGFVLVGVAFLVLGTFASLGSVAIACDWLPGFTGAVNCVQTGLFLLVVWGFFGGAICRIASVEVATDERISMKQACKFACKNYSGYLLSVLAPIMGMVFLLLGVVVWAMLCRIPVVDLICAIFLTPLAILAGLAVAVVAVGLVFGLPLLFPALSAEGSDAFDALSRTYGYIFVRPWRYAWYLGVSLVYGLACVFIMKLFLMVSIMAVDKGIDAGQTVCGGSGKWQAVRHNAQYYCHDSLEMVRTPLDTFTEVVEENDFTNGPLSRLVKLGLKLPETPDTLTTRAKLVELPKKQDQLKDLLGKRDSSNIDEDQFETISKEINNLKTEIKDIEDGNVTENGIVDKTYALILAIWLHIFVGFLLAYVVSLMFSMSTITYMLMRRKNDGTDMSEVYLEEEGDEDYLETTLTEATGEQPAEEASAPEPAAEEEAPAEKPKKTTKKKAEEAPEEKPEGEKPE